MAVSHSKEHWWEMLSIAMCLPSILMPRGSQRNLQVRQPGMRCFTLPPQKVWGSQNHHTELALQPGPCTWSRCLLPHFTHPLSHSCASWRLVTCRSCVEGIQATGQRDNCSTYHPAVPVWLLHPFYSRLWGVTRVWLAQTTLPSGLTPLHSAFPPCQGQGPVIWTDTEKMFPSLYLFLVPHKVPLVQKMEFQGRDESGLVGCCGKAMVHVLPSLPETYHPPSLFHFSAVACLTHPCFRQRCLQWAWPWHQQPYKSQERAFHWLCLAEARTLSNITRLMF